jgi:malate synthase
VTRLILSSSPTDMHPSAGEQELLTEEAVRFLTELHDEFEEMRRSLLQLRAERRRAICNGPLPDRLLLLLECHAALSPSSSCL